MANYEQDIEARWQNVQQRLSQTDLPEEIRHLVRAVAGADDPVMTCELCQEWLPTYVDDELSGMMVAKLHPDIKKHLDLCADCQSEYLEMLNWGREEEAMQLPSMTHGFSIPKPDLSFLPPIPTIPFPAYIRSVVEKLIGTLVPQRMKEFQMIVDPFFERLKIAGPNHQFQRVRVLSAGKTSVMQFLAATHDTTRKLMKETDIEGEAWRGTLRQSVRAIAEEEARRLGFREEEARRFGEKYAEIVCQEPGELQNVVD